MCGRHPTQRGLIDYPAFCGVTDAGERVPEVDPRSLAAELAGPSPPSLVDVREPGEWAIAHLPKARLVPKGSLAERLGTIPKRRPIVVYCKSGQRSAAAVRFLLDHGFTRVRSLAGGLDDWAETVDRNDAPLLNPWRGSPGSSSGFGWSRGRERRRTRGP